MNKIRLVLVILLVGILIVYFGTPKTYVKLGSFEITIWRRFGEKYIILGHYDSFLNPKYNYLLLEMNTDIRLYHSLSLDRLIIFYEDQCNIIGIGANDKLLPLSSLNSKDSMLLKERVSVYDSLKLKTNFIEIYNYGKTIRNNN